ncbi:MAG: hypothetical protein U1F77_00205 [Kiritimatiellia bacterium]
MEYYYNYRPSPGDPAAKKVARVEEISATPPVVGPRLEALATQLALHHPDIRRELGLADGEDGSAIPVTLEVSQSERSRHLCAAPVFHHKGLALWTLVDLADWQVIGWQWTTVENGRPSLKVTERSLQNDAIMEAYCDTDRKLARDGWDITYRLTRSDGLEIVNVAFQGKPVLRSAKLVEWHVSYLFNNGFGYTDAMGCPMFSSSKVVAFRGPELAGLPARPKPWRAPVLKCRISAARCGRWPATFTGDQNRCSSTPTAGSGSPPRIWAAAASRACGTGR